MSQKDIHSILWKECKDVFLSASNQNLRELLCEILGIVRKNYAFFHKIADLNFLDYVMEIDANDYLVGTTGDDFELRLKESAKQDTVSDEFIWVTLSQLIWDLILPTTDRICPFCHCDNLTLLMDEKRRHVYESCENCLWLSENDKQIMRLDNLLPASKDMVAQYEAKKNL